MSKGTGADGEIGQRRFSEEGTRYGMKVVLAPRESSGSKGMILRTVGSRQQNLTSPTTPPGPKDMKSGASADTGSAEAAAWTKLRQLSADEMRAQEVAEAVKQKKAAFAMSPPKLQNIESRQLLVAWDPSKLEEVEYHLDMASGSSAEFVELYCGAELEFLVTGLSPGVSHSFRLYAATATLTGDCSPVSTVQTVAAPPDVPSAPRQLQRNRTSLSLKWAAVADNGAPIATYLLEWDKGASGGGFVELYTGKERQHKVADKLEPGHAYSFRLRAENKEGPSAFSQVSTHYTSAGVPSVPEAPSLVCRSSTSITVAWEEPECNGACVTEYKLEMDDPDTGYGFRSAYSGDARKDVLDKLKPAAKYKFRVSASNAQGSSKPSEVASFLTLAAAPGCPQNVRLNGAARPFSCNVQWDVPAFTGGGEVVGYIVEVAKSPDTSYKPAYSGSEHQCQVTGLEPGFRYLMRVAAHSEEGGSGEWAQPLSVKLPATVPGSPSQPSVSGRPKSSSVLLTWGPPEFTGGAEVSSYTLEVASEASSGYRAVYDGPRTSHNVSTLQPGMTYKFRVKAGNQAGKGMYSPDCTANTGAAPPGSPNDVMVTGTSSSALQISWEAAPTHGTPVREYVAEQEQGGDFAQVYRGKDLSCEVRSLKPAASHSFRVAAVSDSGQGAWSLVSSGATLDGPPAAVAALSLLNSSSTELTVSWPVPPCHGQPITHYYLELVGHQQSMTETSTRATFTDLRPSTAHRVRVQAVNRIGSGPFSSVLTASTRAARPAAPAIELAGCYHNALKFRWTARQGCDYRLQLATANQSSFETVYSGAGLSYKMTGLDSRSKYRVRVCAENEAGVSDYSAVLTFETTEPPPPPPKDFKVESIKEDSAVVCWHPVVANGPPDAGCSASCQFEVQCMEEGGDYRTIFTGDGSSESYTMSSLRSGAKYGVRARVKVPSAVSQSSGLYSAFSRVVSFTTVSSVPASSSTDASKVERRKSPKPQAIPSSTPSTAASAKSKPYQRNKKPSKTLASVKTDAVPTDQRQAIFILVLFGLVTVLVAVAASLFIMG